MPEIIPYVPNVKRKRYYITCETNIAYPGKGCSRKLAIHTLQYIQTHWYVSPYSCTGGDYWNCGEGNFICPKCGYRNRLEWSGIGNNCKKADPSRVKFQEYEMRKQFGSIVDEYVSGNSNGGLACRINTIIPIKSSTKQW